MHQKGEPTKQSNRSFPFPIATNCPLFAFGTDTAITEAANVERPRK